MQRIMNSIAASAEEWGISPRVAWIIALLPIIGAAAVLMTLLSAARCIALLQRKMGQSSGRRFCAIPRHVSPAR